MQVFPGPGVAFVGQLLPAKRAALIRAAAVALPGGKVAATQQTESAMSKFERLNSAIGAPMTISRPRLGLPLRQTSVDVYGMLRRYIASKMLRREADECCSLHFHPRLGPLRSRATGSFFRPRA